MTEQVLNSVEGVKVGEQEGSVQTYLHQFLSRYPHLTTDSLLQLLRELLLRGSCPSCLLRVLQVEVGSSYLIGDHELLLSQFAHAFQVPLDSLHTITTPCSTCFGYLQPAGYQTITRGVYDEITKAGYDAKSCQTNVSLPIGIMVRERLFWCFVRSQLSGYPPEETVPNLRQLLRYIVGNTLEQTFQLRYDNDSKFSVVFHLDHEETSQDHRFLSEPNSKEFDLKWVHTGNSRAKVADNLKGLSDSHIHQLNLLPWSPVTRAGSLEKVELHHESIFLAGRYTKLVRGVSQTPWVVNGRVLAEHSVSDLIGQHCQKRFRCSSINFCSSGREDADVRMLGTGRPYSLELINPRTTHFDDLPQELHHLTELVNTAIPCLVRTTPLTLIDRSGLECLKEGEDSKVKYYRALVWVVNPIPDQASLDRTLAQSLPPFPVTLQQLTPLRVLHRRSPLNRPKLIHHLTLTHHAPHYLILELAAEAGTYIKEFVHGDTNRTTPNLATWLNQPAADILELDVVHIELDWPPASPPPSV